MTAEGPRTALSAQAKSRYRREEGEPCIDVAVECIDRLFDNRDPAPFRDRDLHPSLLEYLIDAAEDLASAPRLRVIFWLRKAAPAPGDLELAYRAHFDDALSRLARQDRQRLGLGLTTLAIAVVLIVVLFAFSEILRATVTGTIGTALAEGVVMVSWVVLWRPAEALLYDWIPVRRERRIISKLLHADVQLRSGMPPLEVVSGVAKA